MSKEKAVSLIKCAEQMKKQGASSKFEYQVILAKVIGIQ